ncbi:MAG: lysine 2,3-aminomutase [Peptococcaceae bacterium BICA1-7]|nr:MAG: lysine 2,3-aminomutase [Peptococcaceae bacterium BICA1-7]HBV96248.1 glutamate 2,3-aminomutase [Desulfotomaculum sp.]
MSIGAYDRLNHSEEEKRAIALTRAAELRKRISDYTDKKDYIKTGFDMQDRVRENRESLLRHFSATEEDWKDWRWHMAHRITGAELLKEIFHLSEGRCREIKMVGNLYRWAISPYYASLMDPGAEEDAIMLQSVPSVEELDESGYSDPMAEEYTSPAPCITRRYPDRLIINVTNQCAMYCRHCQRRRNIGENDRHQPRGSMVAALDYIRKNREIRDVLITGGDALLLDDRRIDWLLGELDSIDHVEIKRIGTRAIVTMPQRITQELCDVLKKHPPVFINTQFNHPREITPESKLACDMLVGAGVVLGNQAVLLRGINNDPLVMKKLNQELLKIRVRPYYIFHAKQVKGTGHFITSVEEGLAIIEKLRGYTSGLAVPTYIINAPNGYGKTPLLPQYLIGRESGKVKIRTWENRILECAMEPS